MVATVTNIGSASATVHYFEQDGYYAKGDPRPQRGRRDEAVNAHAGSATA